MCRSKGCWSQRTGLEKTLTIIVTLIGLVTVGLLVGLIVVAVTKNNELDEICLTKACIEESSNLLVNMNQEADPYDLENVT